jgi:hypothetical protein
LGNHAELNLNTNHQPTFVSASSKGVGALVGCAVKVTAKDNIRRANGIV